MLDWYATLPTTADPSCLSKAPTHEPKKSGKKPDTNAKPTAKDLNVPFNRWDTNKDEFLSFDEYETGQKGGNELAPRYQAFDKDNDGKVSRKEFVGK